ncbi:toll/interleukin-1 receptor domain-containing protein [Acaryochloris marina]|uniref:TIR domain-containing protein n=1 Tax=Acaryochloris marina (strain MBIC 11017) TaxID=329726 RepID=B0CDT5_ACAM1|nr:TIR domain-containing protein [Acaryochloris marina]ABW29287.1 hypothetical protein AM1_4308 [Acaryochloris marina MBIC11017]BDM78208.1 hypothetical protein AM10699_10780 [Acaryochloris marina MBIC10699]
MQKRFRIAFSFAGENRDFVARIANFLADRFSKEQLLYDKFHEGEFARSDLAFYLPSLYEKEADLVVAILCNNYNEKKWCGLEWNAIYSVLMQRKNEEVMLLRFGNCEPTGLFGLAGFVDLDDKTPEETAVLILSRLAINEGRKKEYYLSTNSKDLGWPDITPTLDWPVANHREAKLAFAKLITHRAPFRILPIYGPTEIGKTHLTKQFLRNAFKIPGLTCGRLDFKGSTDIDTELRIFAQNLKIEAPSGRVVSQLSQIFTSLQKIARPTLLIFDTFEMAGEAEAWMQQSLLLSIIRETWLRVIVVGQHTLKVHGEPWDEASISPIELSLPTPEEWFEYGQTYEPGLQLEFVRTAHQYSKGKSTTLAQLLGPSD